MNDMDLDLPENTLPQDTEGPSDQVDQDMALVLSMLPDAGAVTPKDLGLQELHYTPHSPRAGWATQLRLSGTPFSEIQERGRWKNASTLRVYLDAVAASTTLLGRTHTLQPFAAYVDENFAERFPWWR